MKIGPLVSSNPPTRLDKIEYDPNARNTHEWATYCPRSTYRSPNFKVHAQRGHALSRIRMQGKTGCIYRWENGRWEEKVNLPDQKLGPPRDCEGCGESLWVTAPYNSYGGYNTFILRWAIDPDGNPHPVILCGKCVY